MQKEAILYGVIGLLAGSLLTLFVTTYSVNNSMTGMMRMMGMGKGANTMMQGLEQPKMMQQEESAQTGGMMMGMGSSMTQMMESLEGKSGDDFDKAFMEAMIAHHEGAIEMAKQAQVNAKNDEIKNMADNIISAQTNEIEQMQGWMQAWGY